MKGEAEQRRGFSRLTGAIADRLHAGDQAESDYSVNQAHRVTGRRTRSTLDIPTYQRRPRVNTALEPNATPAPVIGLDATPAPIALDTTAAAQTPAAPQTVDNAFTPVTPPSPDAVAAQTPARRPARTAARPVTRNVDRANVPAHRRRRADTRKSKENDDRGHGILLPASIVTGLGAVAIAILLSNGGGAPVASASSSPENPTGAPTQPVKTDAPTAKITEAPTATPAPTEAPRTAEQFKADAIAVIGKDKWSQTAANYTVISNTDGKPIGVILAKNPNHELTLVSTGDTKSGRIFVAQASINDQPVDWTSKSIGAVFGPNTKVLVSQASFYELDKSTLKDQAAMDKMLQTAFDGEMTFEQTPDQLKKQNGTLVLKICKVIHAVEGYQAETNDVPDWTSHLITKKQAAAEFGVPEDPYGQLEGSWQITDGGRSATLIPKKNGQDTLLNTKNSVAQTFAHINIPTHFQSFGLTVGPDTLIAAQKITLYWGGNDVNDLDYVEVTPERVNIAQEQLAVQEGKKATDGGQPRVYIAQACESQIVKKPSVGPTPTASPSVAPVSYDRNTSRGTFAKRADVFFAPSARNTSIGMRRSQARIF